MARTGLAGLVTSTRHTVYDAAGRPLVQQLDGTTVATAVYDSPGELATVGYGNGTALSSITRRPSGATMGLSFAQANAAGLLTSDTVTRSQAGRVMTTTVDGAASPAASYTYGGSGRLLTATLPGHALAYAFGASGNCGLAPAAGKNTNRTSVSDNGGTPTTYCYNQADQLTSSTDAAVGTPGYDPHGNTTTVGAQTLGYDGSDRHVSTTAGTTSVTYIRDATDRIVARTEAGVTVHYGYSGPGDASAFTTDAANLGFTDRTVGLVGGAMVTKRSTGDVWSYPNIHGDVVATADPAGAKRGATVAFDPFGATLTPTSATAPDGLADNSAGNFDYGWLGQAQRGLEHAPGIATIEMGARPYVPGMGRFLAVDPVEGGSANDYDYCNGDPVNCTDLGGEYPAGLSRAEFIYCAFHPVNCAQVAGIRSCAQGEADRRFPTVNGVRPRDQQDNRANAFLHCAVSAGITLAFSASIAEGFGDRRETRPRARGESQDLYDRRKAMDLSNNRTGRGIGQRAVSGRGTVDVAQACYDSSNLVALS